MTGVGWASAAQVAEAIRRGETPAVEALAEQLDRIARVDSELCSVVTVDAEAAQRRAEEADSALAAGEV
jgi:Asp-tRNA(Asn)/Glu-tRNA(Gln) amidotransferase A subunit family amidase